MSFRFKKLWQKLWRSERGSVAVGITVMLTALVGLTGAATDLGMLYTAKTELQNAADAAALGAAKNMLTWDENNQAITTCEEAFSTALQVSWANKALGKNLLLLEQDYTIGLWDPEAGAFVRVGASSDPDDINAVQVTLRRDNLANSPVTTMFAGIVGASQVNVDATSLAYVGYPSSAPAGTMGVPIALKESAVTSGDGPSCGTELVFHDENNENASWTTFDIWPSNDRTVRDIICGCHEVPFLEIGDHINIINGNLSNWTFWELQRRFEYEGTDTDGDGDADEWTVILPVVDDEANSGPAELKGFATFVIQEVRAAPHKDVRGILKCGTIVPNSDTGGPNFGARASNPKLLAVNTGE